MLFVAGDKGTSCYVSESMRVNPNIVLCGSKKVNEEYFLNSKNSRSRCFLSRLMAQQNMPSSPEVILELPFLGGDFINYRHSALL